MESVAILLWTSAGEIEGDWSRESRDGWSMWAWTFPRWRQEQVSRGEGEPRTMQRDVRPADDSDRRTERTP